MAANVPITPSTPQVDQLNTSQVDQNTPQVEQTVSHSPFVDATKVVLENANAMELKAYLKYYASKEAWPTVFSDFMYYSVLQDILSFPRHILLIRHTVRDKFLELIKDPNMINQRRTKGEKVHDPLTIDAMLKTDYRGNYPHFLLVAARQFMIVQTYPSVDFVWSTGWPTNYPDQLVIYPWAVEYHRLCQAAAAYYLSSKEIRDVLNEVLPASTEELRERSTELSRICSGIPEFALRRAVYCNLKDFVYSSVLDDASRDILHRFFVRCDHHVGVSVTQLREHFVKFFADGRAKANDEDTQDWYEESEKL